MERHMQRITVSSLVLAATASAALAHPANHAYDVSGSAFHMLTQPDHLALIAAVAFAVFMLTRKVRRRA
jgi:hydrogenase/urease accessory protein HupE